MRKLCFFAVCSIILCSGCGTAVGSGAYMGGSLGGMFGSAVGGIVGGGQGSTVGTVIGMAGGAVVGGAMADASEKKARRVAAPVSVSDTTRADTISAGKAKARKSAVSKHKKQVQTQDGGDEIYR